MKVLSFLLNISFNYVIKLIISHYTAILIQTYSNHEDISIIGTARQASSPDGTPPQRQGPHRKGTPLSASLSISFPISAALVAENVGSASRKSGREQGVGAQRGRGGAQQRQRVGPRRQRQALRRVAEARLAAAGPASSAAWPSPVPAPSHSAVGAPVCRRSVAAIWRTNGRWVERSVTARRDVDAPVQIGRCCRWRRGPPSAARTMMLLMMMLLR